MCKKVSIIARKAFHRANRQKILSFNGTWLQCRCTTRYNYTSPPFSVAKSDSQFFAVKMTSFPASRDIRSLRTRANVFDVSFLSILGQKGKIWVTPSLPEVLALKRESGILGQWSNPVSGSRKSQVSSPWAKKQRLICSITVKPHSGWDECPRILLLGFVEQGTLFPARTALFTCNLLTRV